MTLNPIFQDYCLKVIQVCVLINSSHNKTNKCTNVKIDLITFGKPVKCHTFKLAVLIKTFLHRCLNPSLIRYATHVKTCGPHSHGILLPLNNNNNDMSLTKNTWRKESKKHVTLIKHLHHTCLDISTKNISEHNSIHILMIAQE